MKFEDYKNFVKETDYFTYCTYTEGVWCVNEYDYCSILWEDVGGVYSGSILEDSLFDEEDFVVINIDTQQGFHTTIALKSEYKISYESFEELYGDKM